VGCGVGAAEAFHSQGFVTNQANECERSQKSATHCLRAPLLPALSEDSAQEDTQEMQYLVSQKQINDDRHDEKIPDPLTLTINVIFGIKRHKQPCCISSQERQEK
jgi:hypothetical protein